MNHRDDTGSSIPLVLGFVVIAAAVVAGSVSAGSAFVAQRDVQSACDGATLAAAGAVDTDTVRAGVAGAGETVPLGAVQQAAVNYLARDPSRQGVQIATTLSSDALRVTATCVEVRPVVFGAVFGFGDGVRHVVTSSASTVLR